MVPTQSTLNHGFAFARRISLINDRIYRAGIRTRTLTRDAVIFPRPRLSLATFLARWQQQPVEKYFLDTHIRTDTRLSRTITTEGVCLSLEANE